MYPPRNLTAHEAKIVVDTWQEALAAYSLSAHAISEACKRYWSEPENKFFPHPGAIIAIARKIPDPGFKPELIRRVVDE